MKKIVKLLVLFLVFGSCVFATDFVSNNDVNAKVKVNEPENKVIRYKVKHIDIRVDGNVLRVNQSMLKTGGSGIYYDKEQFFYFIIFFDKNVKELNNLQFVGKGSITSIKQGVEFDNIWLTDGQGGVSQRQTGGVYVTEHDPKSRVLSFEFNDILLSGDDPHKITGNVTLMW
jgi:hypothetical protein